MDLPVSVVLESMLDVTLDDRDVLCVVDISWRNVNIKTITTIIFYLYLYGTICFLLYYW